MRKYVGTVVKSGKQGEATKEDFFVVQQENRQEEDDCTRRLFLLKDIVQILHEPLLQDSVTYFYTKP